MVTIDSTFDDSSNDQMFGQQGNDTLNGGGGFDICDGGGGFDTGKRRVGTLYFGVELKV
jgi:Ca2+-binding RTX toxin-like protein